MIQKDFANHVLSIITENPEVIGLAAAGSWITNELDEYSDLDLVLVTKHQIAGDKKKMIEYAGRFGKLLSAFTGEHVGEPRVLICLYDEPLIHVDVKFLTLPEFNDRVENPVILFERDRQLSRVIDLTKPEWPYPDYQWIEDRFWTWMHYIAGKIARGEYFEAIDGLAFVRKIVLSPLLLIKNKELPKGLRKVEMILEKNELAALRSTIGDYERSALVRALDNTISLYRQLRKELFSSTIQLREKAEQRSVEFLEKYRQ